MSARTFEPLRLKLPDNQDDASKLIRKAMFGPVDARSERMKIASESDGAFSTYVLIEAARCKDIGVLFEGFEVNHSCLYQGGAADEYALQAPFLAEVTADDDFADWLINEAWGKGFVVCLRSNNTMDALRHQFRKLTQLYDPENGHWYHFRFYAPEVVRRTLPALSPKDFSEVSQGIAAFVTESADAKTIYVV